MGKFSKRKLDYTLIIIFFLALGTFATFAQVLRHEFINLDDNVYVTENPQVLRGLSLDSVKWAFTAIYRATWQPLIWLSYMLDMQVYGLRPMGFHLTNVIFHIANVLLLFLVLNRMTEKVWRSALVAALFAVHPLHIESVAWVAERKDVVSTFFWMFTMWAYVRYALLPKVSTYIPVVVFFALGLMAKPMLVTLPFVLLLLDYWPLNRIRPARDLQFGKPSKVIGRLVVEKIPLFVLALASSVLAVVVQKKGGALSSTELVPVGVRIANALYSYSAYIVKTIWPVKLAILYPHPGDTLAIWQVIGSAALLIILTIFAILLAKAGRQFVAVGWLWFVGTLLPVIGIVQIGPHGMADRFTYIPLVGLFMIAAWGIPDVIYCQNNELSAENTRSRFSYPTVIPFCALVVLAALIICTQFQLTYWKNNTTIFARALECTRCNYLMQNNMGLSFAAQGKYELAIKHYARGLELRPDDAQLNNNMGVSLADLGRIDEAMTYYQRAIELDPKYAMAHNNLGIALAQKGRLQEAIEHYEAAIRLNPNFAEAHNNLAVVLISLGKTNEALGHYLEAIRINPTYASAHINLANELAKLGQLDNAVEHYRAAVQIQPENPVPHYRLANILFKQRKYNEAIEEYRKVLELVPKLAAAHNNLAVALYFVGNYAGAWEEVKLSRKYGGKIHPQFLRALSEKMPEPKQ
ncbi:MAG: tetratricopeptide repeat protein [Armatimonadota bacterium]|nr:tetratricopeptide repeat protein [Armatimonadota bacterium]